MLHLNCYCLAKTLNNFWAQVDVFMLMILLANVVGRSLMNPEMRFSTIGMSIPAIVVGAALVTAMRWPNWYVSEQCYKSHGQL